MAEQNRCTPGTYAARHREAMGIAHRIARQNLQQSQRRQRRDYDLRLEEKKYSVGDAVYRFNKSILLGQCKKLQPVWSGPWIVMEVISSVLYRISNRKRSLVTHHDSLKMCNDRNLHIWLRRKRHGLLGTREDDADDTELEQTREPDDQTNNYIGLDRPHERGVQPVRRTGAHEYQSLKLKCAITPL